MRYPAVRNARPAYAETAGWTGTVNSKLAPRGTFALAHNRPPCASMIELQIDSPMPIPPAFVV